MQAECVTVHAVRTSCTCKHIVERDSWLNTRRSSSSFRDKQVPYGEVICLVCVLREMQLPWEELIGVAKLMRIIKAFFRALRRWKYGGAHFHDFSDSCPWSRHDLRIFVTQMFFLRFGERTSYWRGNIRFFNRCTSEAEKTNVSLRRAIEDAREKFEVECFSHSCMLWYNL